MKTAAINKTIFPPKSSVVNADLLRAELNSKILKLLSTSLVSGERALLSSLLADPAALTRLVRHAGLSLALNKALEVEGAHSHPITSRHATSLPPELTQLLMKAKPIAFGSGESYGASFELNRSEPHGSSVPSASQNATVPPNNLGFGVATPFAPTSSDFDFTIDYLVDEHREEFDPQFSTAQRHEAEQQPAKSPANYAVLALMAFVSLLLVGFICLVV